LAVLFNFVQTFLINVFTFIQTFFDAMLCWSLCDLLETTPAFVEDFPGQVGLLRRAATNPIKPLSS